LVHLLLSRGIAELYLIYNLVAGFSNSQVKFGAKVCSLVMPCVEMGVGGAIVATVLREKHRRWMKTTKRQEQLNEETCRKSVFGA
jgi:hypothetical protein